MAAVIKKVCCFCGHVTFTVRELTNKISSYVVNNVKCLSCTTGKAPKCGHATFLVRQLTNEKLTLFFDDHKHLMNKE